MSAKGIDAKELLWDFYNVEINHYKVWGKDLTEAMTGWENGEIKNTGFVSFLQWGEVSDSNTKEEIAGLKGDKSFRTDQIIVVPDDDPVIADFFNGDLQFFKDCLVDMLKEYDETLGAKELDPEEVGINSDRLEALIKIFNLQSRWEK